MYSSEDFVRIYMEAWKNGDTLMDVARTMGKKHSSVQSQMGKLRSLGVNLPHLRTTKNLSLPRINAIVDGYMKDTPNTGYSCRNCGKELHIKKSDPLSVEGYCSERCARIWYEKMKEKKI